MLSEILFELDVATILLLTRGDVGGLDLRRGAEDISQVFHCPVMCFLGARMKSACTVRSREIGTGM